MIRQHLRVMSRLGALICFILAVVFIVLLYKTMPLDIIRQEQLDCINNLNNIGIAFRTWALEKNDHYPFNVSTNKGGTLEVSGTGPGGFDTNAVGQFQVISNELSTPRVLVCPSDHSKTPATDFSSLRPENLSYLVRSGPTLTDTNSNALLLLCPVHGNSAYCDGSPHEGAKLSESSWPALLEMMRRDRRFDFLLIGTGAAVIVACLLLQLSKNPVAPRQT